MRMRDREWRWFAASAGLLALLVAAWPGLDLRLAARFAVDGGFPVARWPAVQAVYVAVPWLGRGFGLLAVVLCFVRRWPRAPWRRRLLTLGLGLWLGVGLLVNGALKEGWGRARPAAVLAHEARYTPALRPAAQCRSNCSFVSGHAATGFVLGAVGLLGAPATRRRWLRIGWAAGLAIGGMRMAQGGHFLSDVLYSGLAVWGCNLVIRAVWLRRRCRRISAAASAAPWPSRAWFRTGGR